MRDWSSFDWRRPLCSYDPWRDAPAGCAFYPKRAEAWVDFFESRIILPRGDGFAGRLIKLMEYQVYIVGWLFGWLHTDGRRRYDTVFIYIPKKNGKSAFTSALAAGLFCADRAADKKIYCAASVKEQAGLVFRDAVEMTRRILPEKELRGIRDLSRKTVHYRQNLLTAISCDAGSTEGVEPSAAIVDELHVMDNQGLIDVLRKGMITRRQPLLIFLTTAAKQGDNVCNMELDIARKVRDGHLDMPNYFPVIFEATESDDWTSEDVWKRVNPGYGVSIRPERFKQECELAKNNPRLEVEFKRLNLNMQSKDKDQWLDLEDWKLCRGSIELSALDGEPCAMGIDMSAVNDLTALTLYFPKQKAVVPFIFVPQDTARTRDDYTIWSRQGYVSIAGERCISEDEIRDQIRQLAGYWDPEQHRRKPGRYDVRIIAYDPWRMKTLGTKLVEEDLLNAVPFRQGYVTMGEPTVAFEKLVLTHELVHFGNPVLSWMAANAQCKVDVKGNVQVVKDHKDSPRKIDALVAGIMALGVSLSNPELFADDKQELVVL